MSAAATDDRLVSVPGLGAIKRSDALAIVYRHTHADFKGKCFNPSWGVENIGKRTMMVNRGGTCLVLLDDLTDAELIDRLPSAMRAEARRIEARRAKAKAAAR